MITLTRDSKTAETLVQEGKDQGLISILYNLIH